MFLGALFFMILLIMTSAYSLRFRKPRAIWQLAADRRQMSAGMPACRGRSACRPGYAPAHTVRQIAGTGTYIIYQMQKKSNEKEYHYV
jgi:hypothetical protein